MFQQKKTRGKKVSTKPFPELSSISAFGIFTGLDIEVFDCDLIQKISESGYGLNPKPRQLVTFNEQTGDSSCYASSIVLFPEEAFFLHQFFDLQVHDLRKQLMTTEMLWSSLCSLKEKFVECYVAYLYLRSKNWVVRSGIKVGSDYCEFDR